MRRKDLVAVGKRCCHQERRSVKFLAKQGGRSEKWEVEGHLLLTRPRELLDLDSSKS